MNRLRDAAPSREDHSVMESAPSRARTWTRQLKTIVARLMLAAAGLAAGCFVGLLIGVNVGLVEFSC